MKNSANDYLELLRANKFKEAAERYYHDDFQRLTINPIKEGTSQSAPSISNKASAIEEADQFEKKYQIVSGKSSSLSNEDDSIVTIEAAVNLKDESGKLYTIQELTIQEWEEGKVVKERIYNSIHGTAKTEGISLANEIEAYAANSNGCCTCGDSRSCV